jgi:hypothetical protein
MVICDQLRTHIEDPKGRVSGAQVNADDQSTAGVDFKLTGSSAAVRVATAGLPEVSSIDEKFDADGNGCGGKSGGAGDLSSRRGSSAANEGEDATG